jgi:diguanylate cyclase (GGDEF)-like protein
MPTDVTLSGLQPYLSYLGTFIQLGGTLLLLALFALLRRYTRRRKYFRSWTGAWAALAVALFAVVLRYNLLPGLGAEPLTETDLSTRLIYFVYQCAKFLFFALLVAGVLRYVRAAPSYSAVVGAVSFSVLFAALSVVNAPDLAQVVVWQAPVAIGALAYCALLMLRLPPSRRSLGSSITGGFFLFGAALWTIYLGAFNQNSSFAMGVLRNVVFYNAYLDLLWHLSLGFGMVVLLMEDMKHEAQAAHAELAVAHDNLRRASFYDSVTGALNRQAFADGLGLEAASAGFGAVVMLDMDDLKRVNDEHGHAAGDAALRYLVDVLRPTLRASDKMYRWGGDEFLLVCPGANTKQVTRRIRNLLAHARPLQLTSDSQFVLHVSIGGAHYASGEALASAIDKADRAMYSDKSGRKKVVSQEATQGA